MIHRFFVAIRHDYVTVRGKVLPFQGHNTAYRHTIQEHPLQLAVRETSIGVFYLLSEKKWHRLVHEVSKAAFFAPVQFSTYQFSNAGFKRPGQVTFRRRACTTVVASGCRHHQTIRRPLFSDTSLHTTHATRAAEFSGGATAATTCFCASFA